MLKIRHQSPHLTFGSRSTHTCIVILFTSVDENDEQILEHFSFQEICTGITRVGFRLPNRVHFSLYKNEENIDQKTPLNLGKKLNVPGVRQLVLCKTEHWASEKGQMVSNKTVGLSNYWALCMQKLPSNIVLTYLSTEIQIYCSFFPHKNELLGISWEVTCDIFFSIIKCFMQV